MSDTDQKQSPASDEPGIRRYHAEKTRSPRRPPLVNLAILIGIIAVVVFVFYQFFFTRPNLLAGEEFNLAQTVQEIEELSTVRSHLRFAVVVREESDNIIVRELAEQENELNMEDVSSMLFHDPAVVVELHAVATYGVRLDDLENRIQESGDTLLISLPQAELLDVKLINADTRTIARIKGIFRNSNDELLLAAARRGEEFAEKFALTDSSSIALARNKAQEIISFLAERGARDVRFISPDAR